MMTYSILLAGYKGKMGQSCIKLIDFLPGFTLDAGLTPRESDRDETDPGFSSDVLPDGFRVYHDLSEIPDHAADIWLDFTTPSAVYSNVSYALGHGMRPLVGTSGLTDQQERILAQQAAAAGLGGIIAPNFGLSAVLLMKFARQAAAYFPDAEVIEMHHGDKKDAPSGTALATAGLLAQASDPEKRSLYSGQTETLPGARGGNFEGIHVHSIRLPGYLAHEEVLFGGPGEALTIRQDSFDRSSFMGGVKVALNAVMDLNQLVIGLENVL